ncbi:MAG TPA: PqiC family protein [Syntrophorhabdaceae bacterium]|jgi:hypothetical protein
MKNFLFMSGLACVVLSVITGCANSPATRFYVLSSPPDIREMAGKTSDNCPTIGIGPIVVPPYLTKSQIATTPSENEISYAPFDQWAQPLPGNLSHVLAENISKFACSKAIYQFPWIGAREPDYRVRVEIVSMTGILESKASIEAWWTISETQEKKVILSSRRRYIEPVHGRDYQALVQAYSRILAALSRDVAMAIPGPRIPRPGP